MTFFQPTGHDALFLDFDGTLADLQDDAATVFLAPGQTRILLEASASLEGALAVLSGRDLADLAQRVPDSLLRIGNHGLKVAEPGQRVFETDGSPPESIQTAADLSVLGLTGAWVENKGRVLAIHYRNATVHAPEIHRRLASRLDAASGYTLQSGKFVYELKPADANKGAALSQAMLRPEFKGRRPVVIGDDTTDEDAFAMAAQLGGVGIKVGEGSTRATLRLASVPDVYDLLGTLIKTAGDAPAHKEGPSGT